MLYPTRRPNNSAWKESRRRVVGFPNKRSTRVAAHSIKSLSSRVFCLDGLFFKSVITSSQMYFQGGGWIVPIQHYRVPEADSSTSIMIKMPVIAPHLTPNAFSLFSTIIIILTVTNSWLMNVCQTH